MKQNDVQSVRQPFIGNVGRQAWAACAAHRFAMRTALAPRPVHHGWTLPRVRAGLASQLNRWPRAARAEAAERVGARPPVRGCSQWPHPHGAYQRTVAHLSIADGRVGCAHRFFGRGVHRFRIGGEELMS